MLNAKDEAFVERLRSTRAYYRSEVVSLQTRLGTETNQLAEAKRQLQEEAAQTKTALETEYTNFRQEASSTEQALRSEHQQLYATHQQTQANAVLLSQEATTLRSEYTLLEQTDRQLRVQTHEEQSEFATLRQTRDQAVSSASLLRAQLAAAQ